MDVGSAFVADTQPTETVEPAKYAFDHPVPFAEALTCLDAIAGYAWRDVSAAYPRCDRRARFVCSQN